MIGKDWAFRPIYDEVGQWQQGYEERLGAS
jgi:hypothetical protein